MKQSNTRLLLAVCLIALLMSVTACDLSGVIGGDTPGYPMEWDSYQYGEKLHCVQESPTSQVNCYSPVSSGG